MQEIKTSCNCGCGSQVTGEPVGWLSVTQPYPDVEGNGAKLRSPLHFRSFACLHRWINRGLKSINDIEKGARTAGHPRGDIVDDKVPEVYA